MPSIWAWAIGLESQNQHFDGCDSMLKGLPHIIYARIEPHPNNPPLTNSFWWGWGYIVDPIRVT